MGGFACCKGYWKASVAHLLNKGKLKHSSPPTVNCSSPRATTPGNTTTNGQLPTSASLDHLRAPTSSLSTPSSPATPTSPISLSTHPTTSPRSSTPHPTNRYQIAVFDTRGFGLTTAGSLTTLFTTSSMALDTLSILMHLGWVRAESEESPFWGLNRRTERQAAESQAEQAPLLHVVSWSLGGMIAQELSFLLLSDSSYLAHQLTSLVFTSSSPGGYRSPDEPTSSYLLRNQPPWEGWKLIMRILFGSWSNEGRIKHVLRLHFSEEYLKKRFEGVWPVVDEEECFCVEGCEKAAVRRMAREEKSEERQEKQRLSEERGAQNGALADGGKQEVQQQNGHIGMTASASSSDSLICVSSQPSLSPSTRPRINADVLAQMYASRSPFDKNVLSYLWSLSQHVIAVYTHAFTKEKYHVLHTYNDTSTCSSDHPTAASTSSIDSSTAASTASNTSTATGSATTTTTTRTTQSIAIPSTIPAPPSVANPSIRHVSPLVLTGDNDLLIAPQNSLTLARFLRCPCIVVKASGHMLYVEHPQLFAGVLHKHFRVSRERLCGSGVAKVSYGSGDGQIGKGESGEGWYEDAMVKVVDYTHSLTPDRARRLSTISTTLSSATATSAWSFIKSWFPSLFGVRSFVFFVCVWRLSVSWPRLRVVWQRWRGWLRAVIGAYVVWLERVHGVVLRRLRARWL